MPLEPVYECQAAERHADHFVSQAQERIYRWLAYSQVYPFLLASMLVVILTMVLIVVNHNTSINQEKMDLVANKNCTFVSIGPSSSCLEGHVYFKEDGVTHTRTGDLVYRKYLCAELLQLSTSHWRD
mgnify:CR=1 FL=1